MNARQLVARLRRAADRGATVVEYTLVVGLVAVAGMGAVELSADVMHDTLDASMEDVSTGVVNDGGAGGGGAVTTTIPADGGGGGGGSTTSTTAAPTTTTTVGDTAAPPAWEDSTAVWYTDLEGRTRWRASAPVTVYDRSGQPLFDSDARVVVRIQVGSNSYTESFPLNNGRAVVMQDSLRSYDESVSFTVIDVHYDGGAWNDQTSSSSVDQP